MDRRSAPFAFTSVSKRLLVTREPLSRDLSVLSELYSRFDSRFETRVSRPGIVAPRT